MKNSHSQDHIDSDPIILSMEELVEILGRQGVDIKHLQRQLILFKNAEFRDNIRRYLMARDRGDLYIALIQYARTIRIFQTLGTLDAGNDAQYIQLDKDKGDFADNRHLYTRKNQRNELPCSSLGEVYGDIQGIIQNYFPGFSGFDSSSEDQAALEGMVRLLMDGISSRDEYESRLAEYFADKEKFDRDFVPWLEDFSY